MPSRKGMEQGITWLQSKMVDRDNLMDGINAEICYNIIMDQKKKLDRLGMLFNQVKTDRDRLRESCAETAYAQEFSQRDIYESGYGSE